HYSLADNFDRDTLLAMTGQDSATPEPDPLSADEGMPPDEQPPEAAPGTARLQILGPEPDALCQQCRINDGKVYLIRNNFGDDLRAQPLHEHCAPFWFKLR